MRGTSCAGSGLNVHESMPLPSHPAGHWVGFLAFVVAVIALDLGVLHRADRVMRPREALAWTALWIALALAVGGVIYLRHGEQPFLEYLTGYLVEKALSVDNLFVFLVLLTYFHVPPAYQHRVLYWGIFGALALRGAFIVGGTALLRRFHWLMYGFGALLVVAAARMVMSGAEPSPDRNPFLRALRRSSRATHEFHGSRFFIRNGDGRLLITPLVVVLVAVESTDVVFALDSIPAVFGITSDPFIVFTSNAMAILGLRALFFAISGALERLRYLKPGLATILVFIGVKMLLHDYLHVPILVSLGIVAGILVGAIGLSLRVSGEASGPR